MEDYMNYNYFQQNQPGNEMFPPPPVGIEDAMTIQPKANEPPPPPPIVICPTEVDQINVTLEKNQQCECKDCGKLFNSVWYLKQHAVKHSNDRPFKCKFCFKTYKFRSNLYQHKCPERQKSQQRNRRAAGIISPSSTKRIDSNNILKTKIDTGIPVEEQPIIPLPPPHCFTETEDNDAPITYGLVIQNIDQSQMLPNNMNLNYSMNIPTDPLLNDLENTFDKQADFDSIRGQQLPSQHIEAFVQKNKQKLFSCRKCCVFLPTEESLLRHSASHSGEDLFPHKCTNCRQAFENKKELQKHAHMHSLEEGPWRCDECCGQFRSSVALRRHKDQCRPCFLPPVQNNIMVSVHSPFDPFSFIPTDNDHMFLPVCDELARNGSDSGVGSEGSPNSMSQASPERGSMTMEEVYHIMNRKKKEKEDDEDSGFRSRLNSVTQSCSPDSFTSNGDSPPRKMSGGAEHGGQSFIGGYGTGPSYGQMFFEQSVGGSRSTGGSNHYGMLREGELIPKADIISLRSQGVQRLEIAIAPVVNHHIEPISLKEVVYSSEVSRRIDADFDSFYNNNEWRNDGYNKPAVPPKPTENMKLAVSIMMLYVVMAIHQYVKQINALVSIISLLY